MSRSAQEEAEFQPPGLDKPGTAGRLPLSIPNTALSGLHKRNISYVILDELLDFYKPNIHIYKTEVKAVLTSQSLCED